MAADRCSVVTVALVRQGCSTRATHLRRCSLTQPGVSLLSTLNYENTDMIQKKVFVEPQLQEELSLAAGTLVSGGSISIP